MKTIYFFFWHNWLLNLDGVEPLPLYPVESSYFILSVGSELYRLM